MRNYTSLVIAAIIVVVLAFYMFVFQVNFDEHAVVTKWERADPPTYSEDGSILENGSLITEPGFYVKLPWPIQKVYDYPTKVQILEQEFTQVQTADNASVVLKTYVTWRIVEPYQFFVSLVNIDNARDTLSSQMQNLLGEFSKYRFDQMVNTDPDKLALKEIEDNATAQLKQRIAGLNYGIQIEQVGVRRLILPESTTTEVFNRMRSTRERLAESAKQSGEGTATQIREDAKRISGQIVSFATAEASKIRAQGLQESAGIYTVFADNTELATFLRKVDTLKKMLPGSTLILDANKLQFLDLLATPAQPADAEGE